MKKKIIIRSLSEAVDGVVVDNVAVASPRFILKMKKKRPNAHNNEYRYVEITHRCSQIYNTIVTLYGEESGDLFFIILFVRDRTIFPIL